MKLIDFLNLKQMSPTDFAASINCDSMTIYRILCGNRARLDTAIKIVNFTDGLVTYPELDKEPIIKIK